MKKNMKKLLIALAIVIVIALLAIPKFSSSGSDGKRNLGPEQNAPLRVVVHVLKEESLENKVLTSGSIIANEEVQLMSESAGKIVKIFFNEGSVLKEGDMLVKINDSELQAQLTREKYRLKLLQDNEFRQRKLLEKEAISQADYDVSLNELNVSKAETELINAQIAKTEIRAPFNGVIGLKYVSEGSYVTPSTVIASFQNINPIKIDFSIPEKYAPSVKKGDNVKFKVTGDDKTYIGKIYAIEPKIDPLSRTLKIRGIYNNTGNNIFPGSFADVELVLKEIEDAIMIPTHALVPELKGQKVFLYKNGRAFPQSVETGIRKEETVQITSGLRSKDTLITSGILQLRPGMPVTVAESK
jgi:membrane fusion protein (multidrug efflux system)